MKCRYLQVQSRDISVILWRFKRTLETRTGSCPAASLEEVVANSVSKLVFHTALSLSKSIAVDFSYKFARQNFKVFLNADY